MRYLIYFLRRVFVIYSHDFDKKWDKKLNEILDDFEIVKSDEYSVTLRHKNDIYGIWINLYPYGSYSLLYKNDTYVERQDWFRPSIRTQYRFDNLVLNHIYK